MKNLNQLETFRDTVNHINTGKFLFYASFTNAVDMKIRNGLKLGPDIDLREHFGMFNPVSVALRPPKECQKKDFSKYYINLNMSDGAFINDLGVLHEPGSMYHFSHYISPLRNAEDFKEIEEFPYPDYSEYDEEGMKEQVEWAHRNNKVAVCWVTHMYEEAWQIRGYEQFLEDMLLRPEWCEYILDRLKERNLIVACAAARAGVDMLITGDDVANQRTLMFSPKSWRNMINSRWAEVYKAARSIKPDIYIWYHSDGNIHEIIPELLDIGVNILNPLQPECLNALEVKQMYGNRVVLDGTVGTQTVMPFGTPAEVEATVKRNIEQLGYDGALILSPTHILEPEVPIGNILAFIDTMREVNI